MKLNREEARGRRGVSYENAARPRNRLKRGRVVTLLVALVIVVGVTAGAAGETNALALPVPGVDNPLSPTSERCQVKYAAVLDLAELARRDGKSSSAYQHAFGKVADHMNDCAPSLRYASASPGVGDASAPSGSAAYD